MIGQPAFIGHARSIYLIEKQSRHRFWAGPIRLVGQLLHIVTTAEWEATQHAVSDRRYPPIWFEFLFDAEHKFHTGDHSGCILSLAIACESMFRHVLNNQVPTTERPDPRLFDTLSEVNIRAIFRNITRFNIWEQKMGTKY